MGDAAATPTPDDTGDGRVDVALALPLRDGRILVARRDGRLHMGGSWEFPGGKLAPGEDPQDGARRELAEETGLAARELEPLSLFVHEYPGRSIRFHVFLAREPEGEVRMDVPREWAWKSLDELRSLQMPPANRQMLGALRWRLGSGS